MIEKDLGFVLKRFDFRETSVIANIYTLRFGKITGILKGFYTFKKEFSSSLDVFTLNEFIFYPRKREIWLVSFADYVYDYPYLRENFSKSKVGALFFTLIDRTMQIWDENPSVFYLIKDCLHWLGGEENRKILYIFLIKFLTISGFRPEFNKCIICHRPLAEDIFFSVSKGGMVCRMCAGRTNDLKRISKETSSALFFIQRSEFPQINRLKISSLCEKEIFYLLHEFIFYHLDFDILKILKCLMIFKE